MRIRRVAYGASAGDESPGSRVFGITIGPRWTAPQGEGIRVSLAPPPAVESDAGSGRGMTSPG